MTPPNTALMDMSHNTAPSLWAETSGFDPELQTAWALIESQRRRIEELELLATKDELTGLSNRRGLATAIASENERIARGQSVGAMLIVIDLDQFKAINDTFGHDAGDAALKAVSATLLSFIRTTDHAARLGGDEFVLLLTHTTPSQLNRRLHALDEFLNGLTLEWRGRPLAIHASLGAVTLDGRSGASALLSGADEAMYAAKRGRRIQKAAPQKQRARKTNAQRFAGTSSTPSSSTLSERITA